LLAFAGKRIAAASRDIGKTPQNRAAAAEMVALSFNED
jgi:hypothetical protein